MNSMLFSRRSLLGSSAAATVAGCMPASARGADAYSVEDFRRPGLSDLDVIRRAVDAVVASGGGVLSFAAGNTYDLGRLSPPNCFIRLRNVSGLRIEGNGARLSCETDGMGKTQLFLLQNCRDVTIANLAASDRGADIRVDWKGMDFIHVDGSGAPTSGVTLENVSVNNAVSAVTCSGTGVGPRVTGLRISGLLAQRCYYGLNFQENGDDVRGNVTAIDCRRVYFPYGVTGHTIQLDISHHGDLPGADACILIASKLRETSSLDVTARFSGVLPWRNLVHFVHQPPEGRQAGIRDVTVRMTVDPAAVATGEAIPVGYTAYGVGGVLARSGEALQNVRVLGCVGNGGGKPALVYHTRHDGPGITVESSC